MKRYLPLVFLSLALIAFSSCKKSSEEFSGHTINEYAPMETGRYITYQLDSLIYLAFGTRDTVVSYQVKFLTDSLITDNLGRPAYRIFRFIRKHDTDPWMPDATFMSVNTTSTFEFVENNLRYVKLAVPFTNSFSWKGNAYINTQSPNLGLQYLDDWDYTYSNVGASDVVGTFTLDNTVTVDQRDEVIGDPTDATSYSEVNYAQEKYAAGIGMVYRKFFHSEFQPGGGGYFAEGSYGVTYTMIDHN